MSNARCSSSHGHGSYESLHREKSATRRAKVWQGLREVAKAAGIHWIDD